MATRRLPIVGFIHVCMVNDFMDILKEQIQMIIKSGLYEAMNVCNVGCLGAGVCKEMIEEYIKPYEKFRIGNYSPKLNDFEFHTLSYMQETVIRGTEFHGFYIHSKGVSWPGHPGGKYWRDYMNHYNITEWRKAQAHLILGYETCGVKIVNQGWPMHYSGNFFWFSSLYAARLTGVHRMNLKDRFNAEMWICSGRPIAATLCQDFVDYNTEGVFVPPAERHSEETKTALEEYTQFLLKNGYCDYDAIGSSNEPSAVDLFMQPKLRK